MEISRSLYNDTLIRLGPIDYDNDAPLEFEVVSRRYLPAPAGPLCF